MRLAEIEEAYHILTMICEGDGQRVAERNLRRKGNIGSSSHGLDGIDWNSWTGRFHLDNVTMVGHSFGGATTIEVVRDVDNFDFIGQAIVYDIWGVAVQPPEERERYRSSAPLLCINSEAFMYWPKNFESIKALCDEAKAHDALCWVMTLRGSVHVSQSDFSLLYPTISSMFLKMTCNPRRAMDLNINASLEFLKIVMPNNISAINRATNEHLLKVEVLDKLPNENRPIDEKWIAMRLHIPHELALRLTPQFVRRWTRRKKRQAMGKPLPRDPNGKVIDGLLDPAMGEEIWMHIAPTKDEISRHEVNLREAGETDQSSHLSTESG